MDLVCLRASLPRRPTRRDGHGRRNEEVPISYDPAYTATFLARRVALPQARVVLDVASDMLRSALAEQPRDRAWHDGPLDSPQVLAAADNVEVWRGVVGVHERARRAAPPMRQVTFETEVEPGTIALEFTDGPLETPCTVRDQYGDEHEVTDVAWQSEVHGSWFATVAVAVADPGMKP